MSNLVPFSFESHEIRTITDDQGAPWFVLRDVLRAMGSTTTTTNAVDSIATVLGNGHVGTGPLLDAAGRWQTAITIDATACIFLLIRSTGGFNKHAIKSVLDQVTDLQGILKALSEFEVPEDFPDVSVYAIRETETGRIKLGISRDPDARMAQLQVGNSQQLELVAVRRAVNRFDDERLLHSKAAAYKIRGEWFHAGALGVLQ